MNSVEIGYSEAIIIYYFEIRNNNFNSAAFEWFGRGQTNKIFFLFLFFVTACGEDLFVACILRRSCLCKLTK